MVSGPVLVWEPKPEEWVNTEDPKTPVTVTQDVVEVAKALAEAAEDVPDGKAIKVDPKTFATEVCKEEDEAESEHSDPEEDCDWDPSTEDEVEVVQATAAKAAIEEEPIAKMEVEEDPAPPRRRRKLQLGSAQILLLKSIGDADADNWTSLQQCIQEHGSSGENKSELLRRLEQLDLRQQSRQGAIIALQEERDRAWRVSRAEDLYKAELDEEMARLERHNPVGPRLSQPIITDARLRADIAAGTGVWRARRDHRARERAARHRRDNPSAPSSLEGPLQDVDPREGGEALDRAMNDKARKELREFRKAVKNEDPSGPSVRSHQKDSKRRKKMKKQRAKERKKQDARPGAEEGEERVVRFGEGPKRGTDEHVYNPADITHYANWRLDLADANGLALGDDEAESAMRQLQMLVSDVDMLPPLYRSKDDGELYLKNGRPARMLRPRDFCLMILEEGHCIRDCFESKRG